MKLRIKRAVKQSVQKINAPKGKIEMMIRDVESDLRADGDWHK